MVFTPDGRLAFIETCTVHPNQNPIFSDSRVSDGMLNAAATYTVPIANHCVDVMATSPDGKYLATAVATDVQIYTIASDGTLTPVLPQFLP